MLEQISSLVTAFIRFEDALFWVILMFNVIWKHANIVVNGCYEYTRAYIRGDFRLDLGAF